jgi:hypothetical protein
MHQYNIGTSSDRTANYVAQPFPESTKGNQYLLTAMDHTKTWPQVLAVPNPEASTVADTLVTNFFCHFRVLKELHSDGDSLAVLYDLDQMKVTHVPAIQSS